MENKTRSGEALGGLCTKQQVAGGKWEGGGVAYLKGKGVYQRQRQGLEEQFNRGGHEALGQGLKGVTRAGEGTERGGGPGKENPFFTSEEKKESGTGIMFVCLTNKEEGLPRSGGETDEIRLWEDQLVRRLRGYQK